MVKLQEKRPFSDTRPKISTERFFAVTNTPFA
jgi:hypothetical protein